MIRVDEGAYVSVDGIKTFYVKVGSGDPVVLIHGSSPGAYSLNAWKLNIEPLAAAGFTVYTFDQPGFGHSDNPEDYSIEYRVRHARAFIDTLGLDRFHVIGNSVGGYIGARIAIEDPRAQSFVTTSSGTLAPRGSAESQAIAKKHAEVLRSYTPSLENMRLLTLGTIFNHELVTEEVVRERYQMSIEKNYEAQLKRKGMPPPKPVHEELRNLRVKTLLLWGNNDHGVTVERGLLLFRLIPNAEFHLFDKCAHWVQWDRASRFNNMVADFLKLAS